MAGATAAMAGSSIRYNGNITLMRFHYSLRCLKDILGV